MISTLGERLKAIRKSQPQKMTQEKFAESIGLERAAYSVYEIDRVVPSPAVQKLICTMYNVNPLYLSGESEIMYMPPDEDEELIDAAFAGRDPVIKAMLLSIVKNPKGWKMLADGIILVADTLKKAGYKIDIQTDQDEKPGP